ncbi:MAG: tetracycline resistance MFS efflux pump, partial [Roseibium sp.]
ISSAAGLSMVVSPLVMTQVFATFSGPDAAISFPGAPFALAGALIVASLVISLPFIRREAKQTPAANTDTRDIP